MTDTRIADHILTKTFIADEALIANRFVKGVTTTGAEGSLPHCVYADAGEAGLGVVRDGVDSGDLVDVVIEGTAYVLTSENIDISDLVSADTDGKAQVATSTDKILGRSMSAANTGEYCKVLLGGGGAV